MEEGDFEMNQNEFTEWILRVAAHLKSNQAVETRSSTDAPLRAPQEKTEHDPPTDTSVPRSNDLVVKELNEALGKPTREGE